ncbi:MAG TPA: biopolymer transporter ExbD [Candidatus Methylacidiphilales bacterium]|jgi:biopolymer transport protein ExbD|nr:biopolymer transporter ExbD [Candidatus Methylacidiphilales bacterium]
MNLRRRINQDPIQLQLAPMIDVILFLLCFFLLTWNLARYEQDLQVKVPEARNGAPPKGLPGEVIINVKSDGSVELERRILSLSQLKDKLTAIAQVYPDQAVVVRAAEDAEYKNVVKVLDVCAGAKLVNIDFATNKPDKNGAP